MLTVLECHGRARRVLADRRAPLATVEKTRHARGGLFGLFTL
jgi:hypothetical protein